MIAADQILRLPLLPLLIAQGLTVRRKALRLPEPEGPRQGQAGTGPSLRLLIAGDSSAAGVGVAHQDQALAGQLVSRLASRWQVHWRLEATTGHATADTLRRLSELPTQSFDIAILALGVNDVTSAVSRGRFTRHQRQLAELLADRFAVRQILACGVPQMEHFPALPQPLAWALGRQAQRLDLGLAELSRQIDGFHHLPFDLPSDPELAAEDGYHPNPKAYALWAERLAQEITTPPV
ncbi:SGNH/GDSL hydrolase family protein [Phaeobacter sp. QD34_3]|uniref:SGNH/GDSL hydrolase family protein n=1 Tax=unclassified Phaeobacter TaxID=2621772 RepID=UPI00237FBF93|nr:MULTISPECIES: SGNH/GDSL hydrolase family protein [unclassified Phaeobacter]MDE4132368.1 SGNH/GDSL hydrolase family protein [Phaeobacter sp. QD34_3]MDE4136006.1 SGNH/GDSL hydrolase family protein [Phaeobacter sp. QD34_24]